MSQFVATSQHHDSLQNIRPIKRERFVGFLFQLSINIKRYDLSFSVNIPGWKVYVI